jgi:hypothetical protein
LVATRRKRSKKDSNPYTTQKDRSVYFFERASFPLRDALPTELEKFWAGADKFKDVPGLKWEEAGPFNIAGRVTALAVDPRNHRKVHAGTACGGVWCFNDDGTYMRWEAAWPRFANQNVGALAIHPGYNDLLICATGEANMGSDSYPGSGVYSSQNGGADWTMRAQTGIPTSVGSMAFDPYDQ